MTRTRPTVTKMESEMEKMPETTANPSDSTTPRPAAQLTPARPNNRMDRHIARVGFIIGLMLIAGCFIILMGAQQKAPAAGQSPESPTTASPTAVSPTTTPPPTASPAVVE
jgi:hypothetical protein